MVGDDYVEETSSIFTQYDNIIMIDANKLQENFDFKLTCSIQDKSSYGLASLSFNSFANSGLSLGFSVTPPSGTAFTTHFNFSVTSDSSTMFSCNFGFVDPALNIPVVILYGSTYSVSAISSMLMLGQAGQSVAVFADCIDTEGNNAHLVSSVEVI